MVGIPLSSPDIAERDIRAVEDVLRSGRLALGPKTAAFEKHLAEISGRKHGIAVNSGTAALHLVVNALGMRSGDEVVVPSFTFPSTVNALLYERVTPIFADIEPDTYNLSPSDLEKRITPRTKGVMVVDLFGHPAEWDRILAIAKDKGLSVIEDSCEALGAKYKGKPIGSFGNAAAFAFYPNKQITTGEGGALVTDDDRMAALARSLRDQGRDRNGVEVEFGRLGYSYRMDEMSGALGLSQIARLDEMNRKRARVAAMYTERLMGLEWLEVPTVREDVSVSWFVYVVKLSEGIPRDRVMSALTRKGVSVRAYFSPIHRMPYIRDYLAETGCPLPVTDSVASRTMALPFHGGMTEGQIDSVARALNDVKATLS